MSTAARHAPAGAPAPATAPPAGTPAGTPRAETRSLAEALRKAVRGEVRFDAGTRALYAATGSNYRQTPIGVVVPRDVDDLIAGMAVCREHDVPVLPRGGGTSLAGQSVNVAVVFDTSKYLTRILDIDPDARTARVEPGVTLDALREAAAPHGLTFGPDPSTHRTCTLGGMIGNNSCGVHSVTAGRTADNVDAMDVLTYDGVRLHVGRTSEAQLDAVARDGGRRGEIYAGLRALRDRFADRIRTRYPDIPRRVSGYGLDQLLPEHECHVARALVGSEGTCAMVLGAALRLVPSPRARCLAVLGYRDIYSAADAVPDVLEAGPLGLEGLDDRLVFDIRAQQLHAEATWKLPEGGGWLLAEFGGNTPDEARAGAEGLVQRLRRGGRPPSERIVADPGEQHRLWIVRESGLGATAHVPGQPLTWEGWEDAAVPPARLGAYLREFRRLLREHGYQGDLYGHFGDGCVHTRINFDLTTAEGIQRYRAFVNDAADLVVRFGGSFSGEHGDGQSRGELLPKMFGADLVGAFREFKGIWDPRWRMNPGKKIDPDRMDEHLKLGAAYRPTHPSTTFAYADDRGDFTRATLRCVGVGLCRKTGEGTMCPSYMVTREEKHSTRGRARLLFEMLRGDTITGGWRDPHVKEALDLCLSCKGCKGECPVRVDMATYKAEFLSHYYAGRLRPRHAYAFGLLPWWARLAAALPWTTHAVTRRAWFAPLARRAGGVARDRELPAFAGESFRARFARRASSRAARPEGPRVLLWPDTFNTYLHPETAEAAVDVLETLGGFRVELPRGAFCCGRPLYDYGMLDLARRLLAGAVDALRDDARAGTPIVCLEPSCAAVFKDELLNLFPNDEDARRVSSQVVDFATFVDRHADRFADLALTGRALVHGHCHHKALDGMDAELRALRALGLEADLVDSGCCGMAGAFGFERDHYEISCAIGERVLLPAVRAAEAGTLIVADGFSCREQIAQLTDRHALHTAEVLRLAMRARDRPDREARAIAPGRGAAAAPAPSALEASIAAGIIVAGAAGAAVAAFRRARGDHAQRGDI